MAEAREKIIAKYHCSPGVAMFASPAIQLPVFAFTSVMLTRLSTAESPFATESLGSLSEATGMLASLAAPDASMILPVLVGMLTMANIETSTWVMNAAEREHERKLKVYNTRKRQLAGEHAVSLRDLIKPTLRCWSVLRMALAALAPGSVVVYWAAHTVLVLLQNFILSRSNVQIRRQQPLPE
ncbi:hypothetical protein FISHEDRAFT_26568, partial [Fistulina hepatica ATCC 64428]